jgi:twitching motility protein PilT
VGSANKKVEGDLRSFTIFDITQTLLAGRKTASVQVSSGTRHGFLQFEGGQIVHAVDDGMNAGETAVFAIFTWRDGTFSIDFDGRPTDKNVDRPTDWLLLEVARNLDEAKADSDVAGTAAQPEQDVERSVGDKLEQRLRHELNVAFKKVAEKAEPARARYVRNAFDGLLRALVDGRGSALFLRPGVRPRVKTPGGFLTLDDTPLQEDELRGFLQTALSQTERTELRERRETATFYSAPGLGVFRMTAIEDDGVPFVAFAPSRRDVPPLGEFGLGLQGEALAAAAEGLVIVAGPLGSGKSTLLASIVRHHLEDRDRFVTVFAAGAPFEFTGERGATLRRRLPAPGAPFMEAMRAALEQRPDVVAVDPVPDRDALHTLMNVARTGRLVLAALDSMSPNDTLARLSALTQEGGERVGAILSETLRAVVDLSARRTTEPPQANVWTIGREDQAALATNDFVELRRRRVAPKAGADLHRVG